MAEDIKEIKREDRMNEIGVDVKWYEDIQKNDAWQSATAIGKRATKSIIRAINRRMKIEAGTGNLMAIDFFKNKETKYALTAFLFFKWLAATEEFDAECSKDYSVPIITCWTTEKGQTRFTTNVNTTVEKMRFTMIAKTFIPMLLNILYTFFEGIMKGI